MAILEGLEPRNVLRFFEELCAIPHGSGNMGPVGDWCQAFAEERGLEWHRDPAGNVVIIKEASPGYENAEPVILQGHLDMVCEKEAGCARDMTAEGPELAVDADGTLHARGTTLGGDDGVAVCIILAALDDDALPHPRLEALLTADEEIGMLGAEALDLTPVRGKQLINIDSDREGVFTVSCAGGCMARCVLPLRREPFAGTALTVRIGGLTGGHSGMEIHQGRANADILLGRVLRAMAGQTALRLVAARGGLKANAIPAAAEGTIAAADAAAARKAAEALTQDLRKEYGATDPGLTVEILPAEAGLPMDEETTKRALCLLACGPNGVQEMSRDIPGLVQTSLNLGILETGETELAATYCIRSSLASQKKLLQDRLQALLEQLGGSVTVSGDFAAWEYRRESVLRERMAEVFREQYGREPEIAATHGGLECGLFCGKRPELDCVSIGPDMEEIHTPRERLSAASVQRVWNFVAEVLRRSK